MFSQVSQPEGQRQAVDTRARCALGRDADLGVAIGVAADYLAGRDRKHVAKAERVRQGVSGGLWKVLFKAPDEVVGFGTTPIIDGLVFIPDEHDLGPVAGEDFQQSDLDAVHVLGFIDDEVVNPVLNVSLCRGLPQHQLDGVVQLIFKKPDLQLRPVLFIETKCLDVPLGYRPVLACFEHLLGAVRARLDQQQEGDESIDQLLVRRDVAAVDRFKHPGESVLGNLRPQMILGFYPGFWKQPVLDKSIDDLVAHRVERPDFRRSTLDCLLETPPER